MKRKTPALTLIMALLFSAVTGAFLVRLGKANPYPEAGISIKLENPQNMTYNVNTILVVFTAEEVHLSSGIRFVYSLDNQEHKPVLNITTVSEGMFPHNPPFYFKTMRGNFLLINLSEGWHKIAVYCQTYDQYQSYSDYEAIDFFVDTVPILSFLSFENKTFDVPEVPLDFTVNQPTSQIQCSLDGQDNVTIAGNMTLSGLSVGEHNLTVYAWDTEGNVGSSETVYFTIAEPEPEPFPTALVITASVASMTVIGIALLVYFRKRNH